MQSRNKLNFKNTSSSAKKQQDVEQSISPIKIKIIENSFHKNKDIKHIQSNIASDHLKSMIISPTQSKIEPHHYKTISSPTRNSKLPNEEFREFTSNEDIFLKIREEDDTGKKYLNASQNFKNRI